MNEHSPNRVLQRLRRILNGIIQFVKREPFFALLILFVVCKLALVMVTINYPEGAKLGDSRGYLAAARSLTQDLSYDEPKWPPGYPLFIAIISGWTEPGFVLTVFAQLALTSITALMLVPIGEQIATRRSGLIAGWLYALSPNASLWALTIMTETLYSTVLVATLWVWLRANEGQGRTGFLAVGLLLGLGAMIRNIGLPIIPIWIFFSLIYFAHQTNFLKGIQAAVWITLGALLLILPWSIRNLVVNGNFALTVETTRTFLAFNIARVLAEVEGISRTQAAGILSSTENPIALTIRLFRDYPVVFIRVQLEGVLRSTFGAGTGAWGRIFAYPLDLQGSLNLFGNITTGQFNAFIARLEELLSSKESLILLCITILGLAHILLSYLFGMGVFISRNSVRSISLLIILTTACLLIVPGAGGQARFRIPVEPYIAILAGVGLNDILVWRTATKARDEVD